MSDESEDSIRVLGERVSNILSGQKDLKESIDRVFESLASLQAVQITTARQSEQILSLQKEQAEFGARLSGLITAMQPLRDEMAGNRRASRIASCLSLIVPATLGVFFSQWHPWIDDIQKAKDARDVIQRQYQFDIGQELRRDDNRLTVLEFRANNVDGKVSK